MRYQPTQIYLDPEEHRRLVREAAERGISLTEYLRQVIANRAGEQAVPYDERSWDGIIGLFDSGPKDTVETMDEEVGQAFEEEYLRSMSRPMPSSSNDEPSVT
ncbi:MAG: hypothetical protein ACXVQX_07605 [Actinomycetota bacterium]